MAPRRSRRARLGRARPGRPRDHLWQRTGRKPDPLRQPHRTGHADFAGRRDHVCTAPDRGEVPLHLDHAGGGVEEKTSRAVLRFPGPLSVHGPRPELDRGEPGSDRRGARDAGLRRRSHAVERAALRLWCDLHDRAFPA